MAIIARSSITVSWQTDITSVTWYYKLQVSTAAKPAKPTTATPSGWTTTEPTYTEGSTNSLYVCQKTTYSDGTFEYSDVSLSSSYEAAKTAYNKSVAALDAVSPIETKSYQNVYITGNSDPAGWLYFASVKPSSYYTPWRIRYRLKSLIRGITDSNQVSEVVIDGAKNTYYAYQTHNAIANTSYRPIYAHALYTLKEAGVTNGYGHLVGIRFQSAYWPNSTFSNYGRDVEIELLEAENCTVAFADTMYLYANAPGNGNTYYYTRYSFDGTTQGFTESGDRNETNHILNNFSGKTGALGIWYTGLFMRDGEGTYQNICTDSTGAINRTANATKLPNPNGFEVGSSIFFSPNNTYGANANISGSVYASYGAIDSRFFLNTTLTANCLTPYKSVYLKGEIRSDGLYYLDDVWWTQEPTEEEKIYVIIGACYDSTTSYCRVNLYEQNTWYVYKAGKLAEYTKDLADVAQQSADSAQQTADSASSQASENREAIRVQGLSLEAFRDEIRLAVAALANGTQIFKGDPLEDYQSEEIPTLLNYPTFTDFFIWSKCSTTLKCSDSLICGTNNYAAHEDEIVLCTTYNDFYQFREDSGNYSWVQMTAAEVENLSNRYAFVSVDEDGVTIKSSKNNQTGQLRVTSDGVTPSRIFCC